MEKWLKGIPVSEGIVVGVLHVFEEVETVPHFLIEEEEEEEEHINRFEQALKHSRKDLEVLHKTLHLQGNKDAATIISAHIQMLEDPMITQEVPTRIRSMRKNVETIFGSVVQDIEKQISSSSNTFFQERIVDVKDVSMRVMRHLRQQSIERFDTIPHGSIIVVKHLAPSHVAAFEKGRVVGIVSQQGGGSSHAALIARSKGIPYITQIPIDLCLPGIRVILDGAQGELILNPTEETLTSYQNSQSLNEVKVAKNIQETLTKDGERICVLANISEAQEMAAVSSLKTDGVGLYRSEYLFLQDKRYLVSENSQYEHYRSLIEKAEGKAVTIRVMDIGGDKDPEFFLGRKNKNAAQRGIRFLLANKKLFLTQLRALLRASFHGPLRVLVPFVTDVQEILATKELIEQAKWQLSDKGRGFSKDLKLGAMIEVPSAVMVCNILAEECDFLSLGTNDLLQFTVGIDRGLSSGFFTLPLGLLKMIHSAVVDAKEAQIPLSLCGEIASDPLLLPLLMGLGIKEFSCALRFIPKTRSLIQKTSHTKCVELASRCLSVRTTEELYQELERFRS